MSASAFSDVPPFSQEIIQKLSEDLQDVASHAQLTKIFKECRLEPEAGSRPARIYSALIAERRSANHVVTFLKVLFNPVRFIGKEGDFAFQRNKANTILAFEGLHINEAGQIQQVPKANTLQEADERAGRLRAELTRRRVHPDVLKFCRAELMDQNYFHAILEAAKSVAQKLRDRTGLTEDGSPLVDRAFSTKHPLLIWNALKTETEVNEHTGTMKILQGMFSLFRNPTAHGPKIFRTYTEEEALDLLTLVSFLHRRIDAAHRTGLSP